MPRVAWALPWSSNASKPSALPAGESLTEQVLEPITVLAVGQPQEAFTAQEVEVLQTFIESGGGLLACGDDSGATMRALTDYAGIDWTGQPGLPGSTNQLEDHPVNVDRREAPAA